MTLVASLYDEQDARRDAGYWIFYMGISVGAFIGHLLAGGVAQKVDWHLGFACAGVGMTLGLIQYVLGRDRLRPAMERVASRVRGAAPGAGALARAGGGAMLGFTPVEWSRIAAVVVFFVFAALFWAAYEQAASPLNLFVDRHADRTALGWTGPPSLVAALHPPFGIL